MLFFFFFLKCHLFLFNEKHRRKEEGGGSSSGLMLMSQDRPNLGKSLEKRARPLYLKNKFKKLTLEIN